MNKIISATMALASAATFAVTAIPAEAGSIGGGHRHYGGHYGNHYAYGGGYHRGRGYWHGGRWIALGVGAAIVAGAAAAAADRDCYWRNGYRYCD